MITLRSSSISFSCKIRLPAYTGVTLLIEGEWWRIFEIVVLAEDEQWLASVASHSIGFCVVQRVQKRLLKYWSYLIV